MDRTPETPANFGCPKGDGKKVNFSTRKPTTLKVSDMKP